MKYFVIVFSIFLSTTIFATSSDLDVEYNQEFTDIIEFVYGDDLLSQGGSHSIDMLFDGITLSDQKIIDIGSGLGGVDFYLATQYPVRITGIDRVKRMVDIANQRIDEYQLNGKVEFIHIKDENSLTSFADNSYDIIFSKEVLLHIEDKSSILKEAFRVLKPGGKLIVLDWLNPHPTLGNNIKEMMEADGLALHLDSADQYIGNLLGAGFNDIELKDFTKHYIQYTQDNLNTLKNKKEPYIVKFGQASFDESVESWGLQKRAFELDEVSIMRVYAIKPEL